MSEILWTADVAVRGRALTVKKTGAVIPLDGALASEAATWFGLYAAIRMKTVANLFGPRGPTVWFAPDRPRPWYLIWAAAAWNGVRIARSPDEATASFYFEDTTAARPPRPQHARAFNYACTDVSKSCVARMFAEVFGYPLTLDPEEGFGPAVEKGETNGAHDGRLVSLPMRPRPGRGQGTRELRPGGGASRPVAGRALARQGAGRPQGRCPGPQENRPGSCEESRCALMRAVDIIRKKRDGHELSRAEIEAFVAGVTARLWPDYQAAALLISRTPKLRWLVP